MEKTESLVIADAGPLIHLDELNAIDVLSDYSQILLADAVWQEVQCHRPQVLANSSVNLTRVSQQTLPQIHALATTFTLHHGEKQALSLCLQKSIFKLISDDTAARMAAKTLNISTYGTLGLLIRSVRKQHRTAQEVITLLSQIPQISSLHIKPSLLVDVITKLRQEWSADL